MALRLIVAGAGVRGRQWLGHLSAEKSMETVATVDVDPVALEAAVADGLPRDRCFASLDEALTRTSCDALLVATSADEHTAVCLNAIDRGLPLLVEKPFTTSLPEAMEIVRRAEARGVPLMVAQNFRYLRGFATARRLVGAGTLGRVGLVTMQYFHGRHHMAPSLVRLKDNVLWGVAIHHLDALRAILGADATGVCAETFTTSWGDLPRGASMRALLELDGGTRAVYTATYESSGHEFFERGQEFYARFTGEDATLHLMHRWLVLCPRGKLPRLVRRGPRPLSEERILLQQFARAVRGEALPECSGRDNLQTMAIAEACVRSSAERRWIDPQELLA